MSVNSEPDTPWLRYSYTSLTTPATTYELNTQTGERKLLKQQPVIGYDASKYVTERVWVTARDGVKVPVSLVYKKASRRTAAQRCSSTRMAATACRWTRYSICR